MDIWVSSWAIMNKTLVSYGSYNKLLQTWLLKTTRMYSLTVLEVQNPFH